MNNERANIVQAEFFLVNTSSNDRSLKDVVRECTERFRDGVNSKEGVRIYDTEGAITLHIVAAQAAEERVNKLIMSFPAEGSWMRRIRHSWRIRRENSNSRGEKEQARRLFIQELKRLAATNKNIAVEHALTYEMVHPAELHELIEAVSRSFHVWFFVFKPNVLTAEKNEAIAHTM